MNIKIVIRISQCTTLLKLTQFREYLILWLNLPKNTLVAGEGWWRTLLRQKQPVNNLGFVKWLF